MFVWAKLVKQKGSQEVIGRQDKVPRTSKTHNGCESAHRKSRREKFSDTARNLKGDHRTYHKIREGGHGNDQSRNELLCQKKEGKVRKKKGGSRREEDKKSGVVKEKSKKRIHRSVRGKSVAHKKGRLKGIKGGWWERQKEIMGGKARKRKHGFI